MFSLLHSWVVYASNTHSPRWTGIPRIHRKQKYYITREEISPPVKPPRVHKNTKEGWVDPRTNITLEEGTVFYASGFTTVYDNTRVVLCIKPHQGAIIKNRNSGTSENKGTSENNNSGTSNNTDISTNSNSTTNTDISTTNISTNSTFSTNTISTDIFSNEHTLFCYFSDPTSHCLVSPVGVHKVTLLPGTRIEYAAEEDTEEEVHKQNKHNMNSYRITRHKECILTKAVLVQLYHSSTNNSNSGISSNSNNISSNVSVVSLSASGVLYASRYRMTLLEDATGREIPNRNVLFGRNKVRINKGTTIYAPLKNMRVSVGSEWCIKRGIRVRTQNGGECIKKEETYSTQF